MCTTPEGVAQDTSSSTRRPTRSAPQLHTDARDSAPRVRLQELEDAQRQIEEERQHIWEELAKETGKAPAGTRVRKVQRRIFNDDLNNVDNGVPFVYNRASQNLEAAAAILNQGPTPTDPKAKFVHNQLRVLMSAAAAQQAESSASRRRADKTTSGATSYRQRSSAVQTSRQDDFERIPAKHRFGRGAEDREPVRSHYYEEDERPNRTEPDRPRRRVYSKRRGGRYDSAEDRSRSATPEPRGPRAFGPRVLRAQFPPRFRAPTTVPKYDGETNPSVWLEDYRLACHAGGAEDDFFVIKNLPLHLADSARTWLEHLPEGKINSWADLRDAFVGNFQGTYARPGNPWDLRNCRQKPGESLREYIRRFSKCCTELPSTSDADVVSAFRFGTTCTTLIHKLGRKKPRSTRELLDIATDHADGEEAVAAVLEPQDKDGKTKDEVRTSRPARPDKKKGKDKRRHDDNMVAAVNQARKAPKPSRDQPKDYFEKLLESPCTNHEGPVRHLLKDCNLMKRFLAGKAGNRKEPDAHHGAPPRREEDEYPEEDGAIMMIFGGSASSLSRREGKLVRREVYSTERAVPTYLRWSEAPITFDRSDHPDHIPQPGRYPLVVAPLVGTKRLQKVLMDGGSGLNILYVETLDALGIPRSRLRPSTAPFHGVVPGKEAFPIGQIDLPVTFGTLQNFRKEVLTFEVVGFPGTYHAIFGRTAYAKFMAVPNYTYLKLKIPGPRGIITVGTSFQHAYECDNECFQFAETLVRSNRLAEEPILGDPDVPESSKRAACSFEPATDAKDVAVSSEGRTLRIGTSLDPK